eukprot:CAMPEP_0202977574 /NCGR_PEP_ID=MMETSP1396-20130829/84323_1 /ASSEMBLY_ACC=CAM_ASM_000872 /TAXON_ID= /ORGANISM="Pseudokeronopsis sp., Strain Brazil" /LENGTH=91 /DNA_ID=CAMNT_0049716333 /DNA_START=580 /DNA_END=855 /DNA_ORIENTATION=+
MVIQGTEIHGRSIKDKVAMLALSSGAQLVMKGAGYLLMLLVMTYNMWIILAASLFAALFKWAFGVIQDRIMLKPKMKGSEISDIQTPSKFK